MDMPTTQSILPIEYIVIVAYLIFLALIGTYLKKLNTNASDFFRGGARSKWWLLGPSLSMSMTSAAVFTGVAGAIFEAGLAPIASNAAQFCAGIVLALFLAGWFRQLRKITGAEVIRERFGVITEQFFSYLSLLTNPCFSAFQLLGLSIFVAAVFGLPIEVVVIAMGCVVGVYSITGGRWAVMATDFVQSLILFPMILVVAVLAVVEMGGIGSFIDRVQAVGGFTTSYAAGTFADGRYTQGWILAICGMSFISQLQLGWSSRFFAAKDGREARKAAALMTVINIIGTLFLIVTPLAARVLYYDEVMAYAGSINKPQEAAFVVVCIHVLPAGMLGLVLVAMFSATASSLDSGLNTTAGIVVRNIVPPVRRWARRSPLTPERELLWGRVTTTCLVLVLTLTTLLLVKHSTLGLFEIILEFSAAVSFPMALPFFLVLVLRSAPQSSALLTIVCGAGGSLLLRIWLSTNGYVLDYADRFLLVTTCSIGGFLLSYVLPRQFLTGRECETRVAQFYNDMLRPVHFEQEIGHANDRQQLVMLGCMVAITGALISLLLLVPNPWVGRLTIFGVSLVITGVGTLLLLAGRRTR
jgi:solute:Na+ symporter, SSS family